MSELPTGVHKIFTALIEPGSANVYTQKASWNSLTIHYLGVTVNRQYFNNKNSENTGQNIVYIILQDQKSRNFAPFKVFQEVHDIVCICLDIRLL